MKIEELFERMRLHDSGVEGVEHRTADGSLRLRVELCNHDQADYREGDPELLTGWLEFREVADLHTSSPLSTVGWGPKMSGEILTAGLIEPPIDSRGPRAELVISLMDYRTKKKDVLTITFRAKTADWIVESTSS